MAGGNRLLFVGNLVGKPVAGIEIGVYRGEASHEGEADQTVNPRPRHDARGNPGTPPEIEAAAFSLTNNQISDVITTSVGYDIIKLYSKAPAKKLEYSPVADKIKNYLIQQKTEKLAPAYLDKLQKGADIQILDADLKAAAAAAAATTANTPAETPEK